jgi:hypothetical protein
LTRLDFYVIIYIGEREGFIMFDLNTITKSIDNGEFLGEGAARKAIAISDKVVAKICTYTDRQSLHEILFYEEWEKEFKHIMCEMYGHMEIPEYGLVIFMERVKPLYDLETYLCDLPMMEQEIVTAMINHFEETTGIQDSSDNEENWGVRDNGDLVIVDCGIGTQYWEKLENEGRYCRNFYSEYY